MHTGEVGKRCSSEDRVVFAGDRRHARHNQPNGSNGSAECDWNKPTSMTPVEEMAIAQYYKITCIDSPARIKEPIHDVHGPGDAGEQEQDPWF